LKQAQESRFRLANASASSPPLWQDEQMNAATVDVYRAQFFGHKFDLSGALHVGLLQAKHI
jgi:hypothetical protein